MLRYGLFVVAISLSAALNAQPATETVQKVQFSKIVINPDISKENQRVKVGTICLFSGDPIDFGSDERTLSFERFERLFVTAMESRGYEVAGKSSNLFEGEGDDAAAAFLVGAKLQPKTVDICDSVNGVKGKVTIAVEWQLYDRAKKQVVETITTQGTGEAAKFNTAGIAGIFDVAFTSSVESFANNDTVKGYFGLAAPPQEH